jgi:ubiquinol-cytochrome c reductase cytochrome b subunit
MDAWTADPVPVSIVERSNVSELMGGALFQYKNCRNCHQLEGTGGRRGPDLTTVGTKLTRDQLIDQVSNGSPGGGLMPAYGKQLKPAEMEILVDFLVGLRPDGQPPAGWATPEPSLGVPTVDPSKVDSSKVGGDRSDAS